MVCYNFFFLKFKDEKTLVVQPVVMEE